MFALPARFTRNAALAAALLCGSLLGHPGTADAAEILDQGENYHVIAYEAGYDDATGDVSAWVVLRIDYPMIVSDSIKVKTTLVEVIPSAGWTYAVRKAGGYDAAVEIDLTNGACSTRFKAVYKPGKTVVDGGTMDCR